MQCHRLTTASRWADVNVNEATRLAKKEHNSKWSTTWSVLRYRFLSYIMEQQLYDHLRHIDLILLCWKLLEEESKKYINALKLMRPENPIYSFFIYSTLDFFRFRARPTWETRAVRFMTGCTTVQGRLYTLKLMAPRSLYYSFVSVR